MSQTETGGAPETIREYALGILESGDLASKLRRPRNAAGGMLTDDDPGTALWIDRPVRDDTLRLGQGSEALPKQGKLKDPEARKICLERFAHHELMAVELFAWALVTWPTMPKAMRRGYVELIADEQRHLELYLDRLKDLGTGLGETGLSDYLWRHTDTIRASTAGPLAFLCAMGLTFEQANLDFTLVYAGAFRRADDDPSAAVMQQIHNEEIDHVRFAVNWLRRLKRPDQSDVDAYQSAVPFPLSAARAKGRTFDVPSREKAGMTPEFISFVKTARPFDDRKRRP